MLVGDNMLICPECGKPVEEEDFRLNGGYPFACNHCEEGYDVWELDETIAGEKDTWRDAHPEYYDYLERVEGTDRYVEDAYPTAEEIQQELDTFHEYKEKYSQRSRKVWVLIQTRNGHTGEKIMGITTTGRASDWTCADMYRKAMNIRTMQEPHVNEAGVFYIW